MRASDPGALGVFNDGCATACLRVKNTDVLHPLHIGDIIDVPIAIDDGFRDGELMGEDGHLFN